MLIKQKKVFGWVLYDWANSSFATTVMAGFFPVFFKNYWSKGADVSLSTARMGVANSIAGLLVALLSPILGSIADKLSKRKAFLFIFTLLGVLSTSSLYLVSEGNWEIAAIVYILAIIGFSGSNTFYDSLLIFVSKEKEMDFISSLGYSIGYLGGGVLFALNVWMTLSYEYFGFNDVSQAVKTSFLMVGVWWLLFSVPVFLFVKEERAVKSEKFKAIEAFKNVLTDKKVLLFLLAYWFYIDGVDTIIRMAVDYGLSIGFESKDLITALLITQFVGFPFAIIFGFIGEKIGTHRGILIAIFIYLAVSIWGAFMDSVTEFYVLAVVIGLVQGGIQSLSRSYFGKLIPEKRSGEYYGVYNMLGKFAAVLGPLLVGFVSYFISRLGYEKIAPRLGIASISILFLIGGTMFVYSLKQSRKKN
ncbi:MAG: MFS transporter [Candidatus Delongbacteria bacterium]|nr:MFS transporter [Candidatus Delongbacteria bacterium]MBN2834301.1 MFS transporter [Candidatus Delongbacteria bacterium]